MSASKIAQLSLGSRYSFRLSFLSLLLFLTVVILFARRPDQFLHPYLWDEEGLYTLRFYAESGWNTLFHPLAGYLIVATKLLDLTAFQLSILWAPEIAVALAVMLTFGILAAVAFSPTYLRWRGFCAIAVLTIPSDAEVFATAAYAFWWAGILLLLVVLWRPERQWLRWTFIVFGGLSSPLIGTVTLLLGLRTMVERSPRELIATALAAIVAVIQVFAMHSEHLPLYFDAFGATSLMLVIQKYMGGFFHAYSAPWIGFLVLVVLLGCAWFVRKRLDRYFFLLVLTFIIISLTVSFRMPLEAFAAIDPFDVAPRYFFYPFIMLSWLMIWLAALSPTPVRVGFVVAFASAIMLAGTGMSRRHDAVDWRQNILACTNSVEYQLPIHYAGSAKDMWHLKLTGMQCRSLISRSLF